MRSLTSVFILCASLLAGCALSPQTVKVDPEITLATNAPHTQGSISVIVHDARTSPVVGSRGGAYPESSTLTLSTDFAERIQQAAERNLQKMGLEIDNQNPLISLNIYLDELNYVVPENSYVTKVNLDVTLRSEAIQGGTSFRGRYQTQSHHSLAKSPNEDKNQELINEVLNSALNRLFQDQGLLNFISQR